VDQRNKLNGISKIDLGSPDDVIAAIQKNIMGKVPGKIEIKYSVK
jgi:hypothetical protein